MVESLYLYCIADTDESSKLDCTGLYDGNVHTIKFKDLCAVVSVVSFKEIHPNVSEINSHQNVVEASREKWTTLPVRFGTIFKDPDGLTKYLIKSYSELKTKIVKFRNKDEYGVKIIFDNDNLSKLQINVDDNLEIQKIRKEISTSSAGTTYFLKLRMDEALRNEVLKKTEKIGSDVHRQLSKIAANSCILNSDLAQIIMNSSYLIDRNEKEKFDLQIRKTAEQYEQYGVTIHASGPWAPYSFC